MTSIFARLAEAISDDWRAKARREQLAPEGNWWAIWLMMMGRGAGKSFAAAQHIREIADSGKVSHIAIVGSTAAAVRDIQVLGPSGLMSIVPNYNRPVYEPSKSVITWHNGCKLHLLSGEEPERARGFNFGYAWMDELCAWSRLQETFDMVQLCMRIGKNPRTVISTTPKPSKLLKSLIAREGKDVVITRGSTYSNRENLSPQYFASVVAMYENTRKGRQELEAEYLESVEGALWNRDQIDALRRQRAPDLTRVVVAIDPAVSVGEDSDETGIIVAGIGVDGHGYILEDLSGKYPPAEWARKAIAAYRRHQADRIIAEINMGGLMCEQTIRMVDPNVPYRGVSATRGKMLRAEPVSALYEKSMVHHVGIFEELEDQLCTYAGGGDSPDMLYSACYALTELLITGNYEHTCFPLRM